MKLLNLNAIAPAERAVSINGVDYPIVQQSLASVIRAVQREKNREKETDLEKILTNMVNDVAELIPSCPRETLMALNMDQLNALIAFANGRDESGDEADEADEAKAEGEGK